MSAEFAFDDEFFPVPPAATDADPAAALRDLHYRAAKLEQTLAEQQQRAAADLKEMLLDLLSFSDQIDGIVQRWGVTTSGQEAIIVGSVIALGKGLQELLGRYQVKAIECLGKPVRPETVEVVSAEERPDLLPMTVLREIRKGYQWPHGLLRRARVVVSSRRGGGQETPGADPLPPRAEDGAASSSVGRSS